MNLFLLLSLIAGALAVDERAGWQSLLAQPVFAALVVGLVTGQASVAVPVGLGLELIWLSILPMRGLRRPDQIIGAITGAGSASLLIRVGTEPRIFLVIGVGILMGLIAGELGGPVSGRLFGLQNRFLSRIEFLPDTNRRRTARKLFLLHTGSVAYIFVVEVGVAFLFLGAGFGLADWLTRHIGDSIAEGAVSWSSLLPAFGAAAVMHLYWRQHLKRVVVLSAVMVILVLWLQ